MDPLSSVFQCWFTSYSQLILHFLRPLRQRHDFWIRKVRDFSSIKFAIDMYRHILDGYVGIKTDSNANPIGSAHKMSNEQAEAIRQASSQRADLKKTKKGKVSGDLPGGKSSEKRSAKSANRPGSSQGTATRHESSHSMSTRSKEKCEAGSTRVMASSG
jgi:hypothetical protein